MTDQLRDKLMDIVQLLSIESDNQLIALILDKVIKYESEKEKENDLEYKYSIENIQQSESFTFTIRGIEKIMSNLIDNTDERKRFDNLQDHIEDVHCSVCKGCFPDEKQCPVYKRMKYVQNRKSQLYFDKKHLISNFIKTIDPDFLKAKYLVNRINHKLNTSKF